VWVVCMAVTDDCMVWAGGYICTGVAWFSVCVGLTGRPNRSERVAF